MYYSNGHGEFCDENGEKCNCGNNTESDAECTSKTIKNYVFPCWNVQCIKCKESFSGHPTNNHQCYKQITVESKFCLDTSSIGKVLKYAFSSENKKKLLNFGFSENCKGKINPLKPGQTVFFVVQPRFMNVDIRIIVDVTQGELNLFMSPQDDSFVVFPNKSNGFQEIYLDNNYRWLTDDFEDLVEPINVSPNAGNYQNVSADERHYLLPGQDCKTRSNGMLVKDHVANDLNTFLTLDQCNILLRVYGLRNRLVIKLPQAVHNLSGTRFFIALRAMGNVQTSYGLIFFRQDQLHIDLFVFFSVFFSCFFLFLAICVVAWKAKQAADVRRVRRRHNVELAQMAQRPFTRVNLLLNPETSFTPIRVTRSVTSLLRTRQQVQLIAQEPTANGLAVVSTVIISLPCQYKTPVHMGLGTTLIFSNNKRISRRS